MIGYNKGIYWFANSNWKTIYKNYKLLYIYATINFNKNNLQHRPPQPQSSATISLSQSHKIYYFPHKLHSVITSPSKSIGLSLSLSSPIARSFARALAFDTTGRDNWDEWHFKCARANSSPLFVRLARSALSFPSVKRRKERKEKKREEREREHKSRGEQWETRGGYVQGGLLLRLPPSPLPSDNILYQRIMDSAYCTICPELMGAQRAISSFFFFFFVFFGYGFELFVVSEREVDGMGGTGSPWR